MAVTVARFFALLLVGVVAFPLAAPLASASTPNQAPVHTDALLGGGFTFPCGYRTDAGWVFLQGVGLISTIPVCQGSFLYGDQLDVAFVNFAGSRTVTLTTVQSASGVPTLYGNFTFSVAGSNVTLVSYTLPSSTPVRSVLMCLDGECITFSHSTPLTALPSGVLNIGGLDILVLGIVVLMSVLLFPLLLVARWMAHKAMWAPSSTVGFALALPHVVAGFLLALALDFQAVDSFFGGWEFIFFPVVLAFIIFVWSIHLFNVADRALALQPVPSNYRKLRFKGWTFLVGTVPSGPYQGARALVGKGWWAFVGRLFGHFAILSLPDETDSAGGAAEAFHLDLRKLGFRATAEREHPLDDFEVVGQLDVKWRSPPRYIYFVDHDVNLSDAQPQLVFHRTVDVPAVVRVNADGSSTTLKEAHTKRALSLPHFTDVPPNDPGLAGIHYIDTIAAATGFISLESITRRFEMLRIQEAKLRATMYETIDRLRAEAAADAFRFYERDMTPLSEYERREDARPVGSKAAAKDSTGSDERPGPTPTAQPRPKP